MQKIRRIITTAVTLALNLYAQQALTETAQPKGNLPLTEVKSEANSHEVVSNKVFAQPIQSPNDKRAVEYLVLPNNLPVLLISDPTTEKAAAALDVNVGSGDDPLDRAGLAHFLEHMLFLGTKKYPEAEEYQGFIQQQGGTHNAFTSIDNTNYFFEVNANHLEGALDRFAQFFVAPLFNAEYVERERNAVHSEFRSKYTTEFRRYEDVTRQIAKDGHPLSRFRTGNLDSLHNKNGELRQELIEFYQRYYAASNMRLVVAGKEPIAELKALTSKLFSPINDFPVKHHIIKQDMFRDGLLPASIAIEPYKEARSLTYTFPVTQNVYWQKKPLEYIGSLLGNEQEGSLLWVLQQQGWAETLSAGRGVGWRDGDTFMVQITLTPEGFKHVEQIDNLLFAAIEQIKREGVESWRFDELKRLADIDFRFKEQGELMSEVSHLASVMQSINRLDEFSSQALFSVFYSYEKFDAELIQRYLSELNPQNVLRVVTAPEVTTHQKTALYQVPYALDEGYVPMQPFQAVVSHPEDVKNQEISRLIGLLSLPEKNPFIPQSLSMVEGQDALPKALHDWHRFKAWHATDTSFNTPKATLRVRLKSRIVETDIAAAAKNELLAEAIRADLNPVTYQAALAGANFAISATSRGIDFSFSGYSDSLNPLVDYTLDQIKQYAKGKGVVSDLPRLQSFQSALVRDHRNKKKDAPFRQLMSELAETLYQPFWDDELMADAIAAVDLNSLPNFTKMLVKQSEVTVLSIGNLTPKNAKSIANKIRKTLVKGRSFKPRTQAQVTLIENVRAIEVKALHKDHAAMVYLQGRDDSIEERAGMSLLAHMLSAPFYSQLRTEEQLGYIVYGSYYPIRQMPGAVFLVQSPTANPADINTSMWAFLNDYSPEFATEFRVHQLGLIGELDQQPKNLAELASRFWQSVNNDDWNFNSIDELVQAVKAFEPESFAKWYDKFMAQAGARHLLLYSQSMQESNPKLLNNIPHIADSKFFRSQHRTIIYP